VVTANAKTYNLKDKNRLLDWLRNNDKPLNGITEQPILIALGVQSNSDQRNYFELDANFAINGSILIRSGSKISDKYQPDVVHLRSNDKPIISGTSLAGVLRHRAYKIIYTLSDENIAKKITSEIFGDDDTKKKVKSASRLEVKETEIKNTHDLVQTRVKIDRFTGGAMDSALFDAAPVFSDGEQQAVNIKFRLRNAKPCEIGLLLLLLKDLWTSDLPIGGESSIGRGRLKGKSACLSYKNGTGSWHASLDRIDDSKVKIDGIENNTEKIKLLNKFVIDFNEKLKEQNDEQEN
jgi:CRISPR/Cas system CSM-associated protein Csm3 (group 7 of RAMP superfamily)